MNIPNTASHAETLAYNDCVVKSGIHPDIFRLNFEPVESALSIYDALYRDTDPTTNSSSGSSQAKRNFAKCEGVAGWICNGRFRQLAGAPIARDKKKSGKWEPRRYHQARGKSLEVFCPKVTVAFWRAIAAKHSLPMPEYPVVGVNGEAIGFWEWVEESNCPIVITEGEKKACCLISRNIVAVGLPGISTGYKVTEHGPSVQKADGTTYRLALKRELRGILQTLDTPDRVITILFDFRAGDYSQSPEYKAASITSKLFKNAICQVATLPGPEKGIDDYAVAGGDADKVIADAGLIVAIEWQMQKWTWTKLRTFTPTTKINIRYFDSHVPDSGFITVIKSGLGTGKTEFIKRKVASEPRGVQINIGYRNSLLLQQAEKWGSNHWDEHDGYKMQFDPDARISLCFDSLPKLPREIFIGATIFLDEMNSGLKHEILSGTLKDRRREVHDIFEYACQVADRVIGLDGNASDIFVDYLKAISGKPAVCIENEFRGETPPIFFVEGKKPKEWLCSEILKSPCPAIATDSLRDAEALARLLTAQRGDGILLSSKTATKPWAKDFLKDPDAYIKASKPNWLIFTPTAESGIDISIQEYFSDCFCWFVGVVGVDEAVQMSRRVRHPERIIVLSQERGLKGRSNSASSLFEEEILKTLFDAGHYQARLLLSDDAAFEKHMADWRAQLDTPHTRLLAKLLVKAELERLALRKYLISAYEESGYTIQYVTAEECTDEAYAEAKQLCKDKEAQEIFDARDIEMATALEIKRNFKATWEERCQAAKCLLLAQFPGIQETELWTWEFVRRVRFEETDLISQLNTAWALDNPEEAHYLAQINMKRETRIFMGDVDTRYTERQLLGGILDIKQFLDPNGVWTADSPEVQKIIKLCKKKDVAQLLGGRPGKQEIRYINTLLAKIGVRLIHNAVKRNGKTIREYSYKPELSRPQNWDELTILFWEKQRKKIAEIKESERLAAIAFDLVADDLENDTNIGVCATQPEVEEVVEADATVTSPSEPLPERQIAPAIADKRWAWYRVKAEWVKCRILSFLDGCYRLEMTSLLNAAETMIIKAYPEDLRWEAP